MYNKSDEQFIIMQAAIKANKQDSDEKIMKITEDFKEMLVSSIISITNQINTLKSLPTPKYLPKSQYPTTVVPSIRKDYHWTVVSLNKLVACGL